ncbi:helix-turn-helix transcriptional regulator [Pseudonocardia sp. H11422]|uniref:helix-turn-helix transcriptional regulator n=1 Tax=Pseudonocardia sp. H11422 TaxID=2835866 RepID=UPI001BDD0F89|nr:LuxR C-terminal-related transcriptional regulator [Pseudonocardia sp. H11422]
MLAVQDPLSGRQRPLVNAGYEKRLLDFLNRDYLLCRTYDIARRCDRPMRMCDYGPDFYRTQVYREFLDGAGYREGITLVLRSGEGHGRVTGLLTMSFSDSRAADDGARQGIEFVAPALGQFVDASLAPTWLASLLGNSAAAFIVNERGAAVPTSDDPQLPPEQLSGPVLAASRAFLVSGATALRGYCSRLGDARWEHAHLVRLADDRCVDGPRALLMLELHPLPCGLTERELDVLTLVSRGLSNRAIGLALGTSPRTIGTHVEHLLLKTGLANRAALASYAMENAVVRLGL